MFFPYLLVLMISLKRLIFIAFSFVSLFMMFHTKPVVILDPFGIYAPLHELIVHLEDEKFIKPGMREIVQWTTTVDEALRACQA